MVAIGVVIVGRECTRRGGIPAIRQCISAEREEPHRQRTRPGGAPAQERKMRQLQRLPGT